MLHRKKKTEVIRAPGRGDQFPQSRPMGPGLGEINFPRPKIPPKAQGGAPDFS